MKSVARSAAADIIPSGWWWAGSSVWPRPDVRTAPYPRLQADRWCDSRVEHV